MALLHQAQLHPSKLELLSEWVPTREWFPGDADAEFSNVAAYRFDDPEGDVGVETILIRAGHGPMMQVPLTYRGAPLEGAEGSLIGTMVHSVLGKRWVYDGAGDPVYLQTVATATLNGGHQAELFIDADGGRELREPNARVAGSGTNSATIHNPIVSEVNSRQKGTITIVDAGDLQVRIQRVIDGDALAEGEKSVSVLRGTWTDSSEERDLVLVSFGA
ncbi:MAG: hypothetical protein ABIW32_04420 [Terrimesophilobacter sp.]